MSETDVALIDDAEHALGLLHGKWKVHLIVLLARGVHRHGRLLVHIPGTSKKAMTAALRALEQDGLVTRRPACGESARVEYVLTPLGWSAAGPLVALADWVASAAVECAVTMEEPFGREALRPDRRGDAAPRRRNARRRPRPSPLVTSR